MSNHTAFVRLELTVNAMDSVKKDICDILSKSVYKCFTNDSSITIAVNNVDDVQVLTDCSDNHLLRIKSPTGCVHYTTDKDKKLKETLCGHTSYYQPAGLGRLHQWPYTSEPVTCKRCKKMLRKELCND